MIHNLLFDGGGGGGGGTMTNLGLTVWGWATGGAGRSPPKTVVKTDLRIVSLKAV